MIVIDESGMYSLILGSRKIEAKKFKKWVTGTVLPEIRKTGSYGKHT
jgi:prophage antirepressor-like protein